jgi:hypothetical protein
VLGGEGDAATAGPPSFSVDVSAGGGVLIPSNIASWWWICTSDNWWIQRTCAPFWERTATAVEGICTHEYVIKIIKIILEFGSNKSYESVQAKSTLAFCQEKRTPVFPQELA